jgi:5-methylcytosine-specific restriction endonuclease McrA
MTLRAVWAKAKPVLGYDSNMYRKDACGALMIWNHYGNRNSRYGWEIDHVIPVVRGGSDLLSNLRPLHWRNNCRKADGSLFCAVWA